MISPKHMIRGFALFFGLLAGTVLSAQFFSPSVPESDPKWDWIKLDSGEWVKGELRVMYEDELEFDSDHFGIITIDWDDIEEIRTARSQTVRTDRRTSVVGRLVMEENKVQMIQGDEVKELSRNQVVSIAAGRPREKNYWTIKGSVGANIRSGNVDQVDITTRATVQRRTALTRLYWDYTGNYSTTGEFETANNHRSNAYFDYFFSKRFFVRPASVEYFRDRFQNIAHRQTYSASLGYTIIDKSKLSIDVTGGPSWQTVEYDSIGAGEEGTQSSAGGIITTVVDWEITNWMDFIGTYRAQWASDSAGGRTSHSDSTLEIELTRSIDLNLSFIWDRIQNPVADDNGNVPDQDDYRFIVGIGLDM
jgi:putative salt-induced outer membrane protein YdiY